MSMKITVLGEGERFAIRRASTMSFFEVRDGAVVMVRKSEVWDTKEDWTLKWPQPDAPHRLRVAFEMETTLGMEEGEVGMEEGEDVTSERQIKVYWVGRDDASEPAGQIMTTSVVAEWLTKNFGREQK